MTIRKLFFGSLFGGLIVVSGCEEKSADTAEEKPLRPVRVMEVMTSSGALGKEFIAVADASRKADLSFKVAGEMIEFPVNQGDLVKKGQLLAKLDDKDWQVQFREADSTLKKAEADFNRGKKLIQANTISRADFEQLEANYSSSNARLDAAKNNLAYTRLTAPFSGVIARKHTENFQEVNAKQVIVSLHDMSRINLKINLPESIVIGARRAPPKLTALFDALGDIPFDLTFEEISTQPDEVTKTYEVTLSMKAPDKYNILPGMTARVSAKRESVGDGSDDRIVLPGKVVLEDSSGNYVFTVLDNNDGTATVLKTAIDAGDISEQGIEVLSGVTVGDLVITAGMSKVSDGMQVKF